MTTNSSAEGADVEPAGQLARRAGYPEALLRVAGPDELQTLCDIDLDASRLFDHAGLELSPENGPDFAAAERSRWLECLQSGSVLVASDRAGRAVGFAAMRVLDGEPYLEQLSVRMNAMRNGIGTALLNAAERVAAKSRRHSLWLTTYRHLPWNAPFYERAGFDIVPGEECGNGMSSELLFQRRLLPLPDNRVAMRKLLNASTEVPNPGEEL